MRRGAWHAARIAGSSLRVPPASGPPGARLVGGGSAGGGGPKPARICRNRDGFRPARSLGASTKRLGEGEDAADLTNADIYDGLALGCYLASLEAGEVI